MAIKGRQFIFFSHRQAIGRAVLNAISTENTNTKVDGVIPQLFLLRGLIHHPIDHRKVDRANPDAHLTGNALIELVVNPAPSNAPKG
jgi:hypothetical protein